MPVTLRNDLKLLNKNATISLSHFSAPLPRLAAAQICSPLTVDDGPVRNVAPRQRR